jgi:hypothetical protein
VLVGVPGGMHRLAQHEYDLLAVERLEDEVGRPGAHRLDRERHRAVRREHDHGNLRPARQDIGHELHAIHARHAQVGHHDVDGSLGEHAQRGVPGRHARCAHAVLLEQGHEHGGDGDVVVHDQHGPPRIGHGVPLR